MKRGAARITWQQSRSLDIGSWTQNTRRPSHQRFVCQQKHPCCVRRLFSRNVSRSTSVERDQDIAQPQTLVIDQVAHRNWVSLAPRSWAIRPSDEEVALVYAPQHFTKHPDEIVRCPHALADMDRASGVEVPLEVVRDVLDQELWSGRVSALLCWGDEMIDERPCLGAPFWMSWFLSSAHRAFRGHRLFTKNPAAPSRVSSGNVFVSLDHTATVSSIRWTASECHIATPA